MAITTLKGHWSQRIEQLIDSLSGYTSQGRESYKRAAIRLELFRQRFIDLTTLKEGDTFLTPGGTYRYRVIGPICRLYDREELPWPCCRITGWKGKEPSWRRVGSRFISDLATRNKPSYRVQLLDPHTNRVISHPLTGETSMDYTLYWSRLSDERKRWWVTPSSKLKHYQSE